MAIEDLYSTRNKPIPDVFNYTELPLKLKNQIVHIWSRFFNKLNDDDKDKLWEIMENKIAEAHGETTLLEGGLMRYRESYKVEHYLVNNEDIEKCLDVIEIVFRMIKRAGAHFHLNSISNECEIDLNKRFLENGVGFQFIQENIIKIDNNLLHEEVIKPVLHLLTDKAFENANEEYLNAHAHFRHNRNKDCLNDCLKAFETTMKIICTKNQWPFDERDTASKLINNLTLHNFFPDYHGTQLNAIKQVLESGAPTIRNKNGAHGQGVVKVIVDNNLASYMLNITGAAIKFLVEMQTANNQ